MSVDPKDIFNAESLLASAAAEGGAKRPNTRAFSYGSFLSSLSTAINNNLAALEKSGAILVVGNSTSWCFSEPARLEVSSWKRLFPANVNDDGSFDLASAASNSTGRLAVSAIPSPFQKAGILLFLGDFIDRARFLALGENSFIERAWAHASLDLCKADAALRRERGLPLATGSLLEEALRNPLSPLRAIPHKDLAIFDKARLAGNAPPQKNSADARFALCEELCVFLTSNIQQAEADGLLTHAKFEVALDSHGAILITSSHFLASHDDRQSIFACQDVDALSLTIEPFPKKGGLRAFASLVHGRWRKPSKEVVFEQAWRSAANGIAAKDAQLRYRRGILTPPRLTASQERFALSNAISAPNNSDSAPKRRHAL